MNVPPAFAPSAGIEYRSSYTRLAVGRGEAGDHGRTLRRAQRVRWARGMVRRVPGGTLPPYHRGLRADSGVQPMKDEVRFGRRVAARLVGAARPRRARTRDRTCVSEILSRTTTVRQRLVEGTPSARRHPCRSRPRRRPVRAAQIRRPPASAANDQVPIPFGGPGSPKDETDSNLTS